MNIGELRFPWLSILLLASFALTLVIQPGTAVLHYVVPDAIHNTYYQLAFIILILIIFIWESRKFYLQKKTYNHTISELSRAKKSLQKKAHTYSRHSDKLKLFISDRLLEYIQYDEKFLHFKNIAAEVRHNGVICFDKVQVALNSAIHDKETSLKDKKTEDYVKSTLASYQEALTSMRYLWDLLDLSTTDNIALHIANHLCECEELYFQSVLQKDLKKPDIQADKKLPYTPTFAAHTILIDCLNSIFEQPEASHRLLDTSLTENSLDKDAKPIRKVHSDSNVFTLIDTDIEMLGNANHVKLLIENLINNAQFYQKKKNAFKKQPALGVELTHQNMQMHLAVYNRGKFISEEDRDKIFQLGYTTRRKKENHGKGLGLYFVHSIVQGYEGTISYTNIQNQADTYSVRIQLDSHDTITEIVETTLVENQSTGNQPMIIAQASDSLEKKVEWRTSETIIGIEVFSKRHCKTYTFNRDLDQDQVVFLEQENSATPEWAISITRRKRTATISFFPLDINGVKFFATLPTAKARLDYSNEDTGPEEDDEYDEIMNIANKFKE